MIIKFVLPAVLISFFALSSFIKSRLLKKVDSDAENKMKEMWPDLSVNSGEYLNRLDEIKYANPTYQAIFYGPYKTPLDAVYFAGFIGAIWLLISICYTAIRIFI